jgi:hypothetical protein
MEESHQSGDNPGIVLNAKLTKKSAGRVLPVPALAMKTNLS